jgi:putative selenium metabolism hydrolase
MTMLDERHEDVFRKYDDAMIEFARALVRVRSYSGGEEGVARLVAGKMEELGYDEVFIDSVGNVMGRIGGGRKSALFDSHMDTVEVNDEEEWISPPFGADIKDGRIYGRGSVDMKSSLAASLYAAVAARDLGLLGGRTIYVTATVSEEYCDGENLKTLFAEKGLRPDVAVICEPSNNLVTLGHKGKAQVLLRTHGVSAHGSAPEKGVNAVYEMAEIITRVEKLNENLTALGSPHGTIVLSDISCVSASLNAVPSECSIYLDRRLVLGETEEDVKREMDALTLGKRASWEIGVLRRKSWTGVELVYSPLHRAWKIDQDHELVQACDRAYERVFGRKPGKYGFWDFGTNAVTPVGMGIPTVGFGPGEYKLAHSVNENCEVSEILEAFRFYGSLMGEV